MKNPIAILLLLVFTFAFVTCRQENKNQPQGKNTSASLEKSITFPSRGVQVPATVEIPDGEGPFPLVVLVHGHGGDRDESIGFITIADALKAEGIASIRMDFPGCGESTEGFQKNTLTNMKQDVLNAVAYTTANYPVDASKVGIFGYSMGGRIALELLSEGTYSFAAIALLAPANSTEDMKPLFSGSNTWDTMKETAEKDGFAINAWGEEVSREWFADLEKVADPAKMAAEKFTGPAEVIYAQDDQIVSPSVSAAVAEILKAEVVDATGDGHFYGFYGDRTGVDMPDVRNIVVTGVTGFFAKTLK